MKKIKDYLLSSKKLGGGNFGQVFLAENEKTKELVAIKVIGMSSIKENPKLKALVSTEVSVLYSAKHENIVGFRDYFESGNNCYLVMEFCKDGDLSKYLEKKKIIPETEAKDILEQILSGIQRLHELKVVHRDIKLENILMDGKKVKIADLEFAKIVTGTTFTNIYFYNKYYLNVLKYFLKGTSITMAPEVLMEKPYNNLADLWSIGVIYYEMLFGEPPFKLAESKSIADLINRCKTYDLDLNLNGVKVSENTKNLVTRILKADPSERIPWSEVFLHKLFKKEEEEGNSNDFINYAQFYFKVEKEKIFVKQKDEELEKMLKLISIF